MSAIWNKADICERCKETRKEHMPPRLVANWRRPMDGKAPPQITLAVTCGSLSSCTAFIEPGEPVPSLTETLPPKSLAFFNDRWNELHGEHSKLKRPHFAVVYLDSKTAKGETAA